MKKLSVFGIASVALLFGAAPAPALPSCFPWTLNGSYVFSAVGFGQDGKPIAYAGFEYYDGVGHQIYIAKYANNDEQILRGDYEVKPNCRVEVTYKNGRKNTYFINPNGKEIDYVVTNGATIAATERWVSRENLVGERP